MLETHPHPSVLPDFSVIQTHFHVFYFLLLVHGGNIHTDIPLMYTMATKQEMEEYKRLVKLGERGSHVALKKDVHWPDYGDRFKVRDTFCFIARRPFWRQFHMWKKKPVAKYGREMCHNQNLS